MGRLVTVKTDGNGGAILTLSWPAKIAAGALTALLVSAVLGNVAMYRALAIIETKQGQNTEDLNYLRGRMDARIIATAAEHREFVTRTEIKEMLDRFDKSLDRLDAKIDTLRR